MEAIHDMYATQASNLRGQFSGKVSAITDFMGTMETNTSALASQFAVTPTASAAIPINGTVASVLDRTQTELFSIISAFGTIEAWLQLAIPSIEDGNNFGVSIVMEGKKMVQEEKKALSVRKLARLVSSEAVPIICRQVPCSY